MIDHPDALFDDIPPLFPPSGAPAGAPGAVAVASWAQRKRLDEAVRVLRGLIGAFTARIEASEKRHDMVTVQRLQAQQRRFVQEEEALRAEHTEQVDEVLTRYKQCLRSLCEAEPADSG